MKNLIPKINHQSRLFKFLAVLALLLASAIPSAFAASQTWKSPSTDANWATAANWVSGTAAGTSGGGTYTGSAGTATFNTAVSGGFGGSGTPLVIDANRNINNILFDTSAGAYTIGTLAGNWLYSDNSGNVTLNATVANPEVINAPLTVALPSSTAGTYSFINNATSSSATLTIGQAQNQGTTRSVVFILDGSNTGNNTVNLFSYPSLSTGVAGITKQGTGTWVLTGANTTFKAANPMNVNGGTLVIQNVSAFGSASTVNISGGTLRLDGITLAQTLALNSGGTIKENGSSTAGTVTVGTAAATIATLATTSSGDVLTVGTAANKLTGGASDSMLHVAGPGTVALGYANNYVGNWSVDTNATLSITNVGALGSGLLATVAAGGILDLTPLGAVTSTLSTIAFGGSGSGTTVGSSAATVKANASGTVNLTNSISLTFTPTVFSGDTTHPALYISQGALALNGNAFTVNNASGTPLGAGTYRLIQVAGGSITPSGTFSVSVTGSLLAAGQAGSIQVSGGYVNLVVQPAAGANIVWQGDGSANLWDVSTTANFTNGAGPVVFNQGDNPTFNDTSANPTVNLASSLQPGSVTVTASSVNYSFNDANGSGLLSGSAGITKNGSSTLTLATANINIGPTVINAGTVQVGNGSTKGDLGTGNVTNNGALVFNHSNGGHSVAGIISGSGSVSQLGTNGGTVTLVANNTYTGPTYVATNATLQVGTNGATGSLGSGAVTVDGTLVYDTAATITVGNIKTGPNTGGWLTFSGAGTATLTNGNTYINNTTINNGSAVVKLGGDEAVPSGATVFGSTGWLAVNSGMLDLNGHNQSVNALSGATANGLITNSAATGAKTLTVIGGATTTYAGSIKDNASGPIQLVTTGAGNLTLSGASAYTGGTYVGSGGTLTLGNSAGPGTGSINLSNLTTLAIGGNTLANAVYVAPGATATNTGTGAFSSNFSSGDGVSTFIINGAHDSSQGSIEQYSGFLGTIQIASGSSIRFSATTLGDNGGRNATWDIAGSINFRNGMTTGGQLHLGGLTGSGGINGGGTGTASDDGLNIGEKNGDSTYSGVIADGSVSHINVTKSGTGTLTLTGNSTYSSTTTISAGTLDIGGGGSTGSFGTYNVIDNSRLVFDRSDTALAVPNYISGTGTVTVTGGGTITLDGAGNGYSGGTTITGNSTLIINSIWALGGAAYGGLTITNGTLQYANPTSNGALDITHDTSFDSTNGVAKTVTLLGNATIDLNGNTVTYTNTLGNGGNGAFNVTNSSGNGVLTLNAANTYTGGTTIGSTATLIVNNSTGSATGTNAVTVKGTLGGRGTIAGNVTVNGTTYPGISGGGPGATNTFGGNLTYAGTTCSFNLGASVAGPGNDMIVLTNANASLDFGPGSGGLQVSINCGVNLDESHDYVLFKLTGASAHVLNAANLNSTPLFVGATPSFSGFYSVVATSSNVVLHVSLPAPAISSATATPNPVLANNYVKITVAATNITGGAPISSVVVDVTSIDGPGSLTLIPNGAGSYTNSQYVDQAVIPGGKTLPVTVTDTASLVSSANVYLTVGTTNLTWNGNGTPANNYWSDFANWAGGVMPGLVGDSFTFAGTHGLSPDMENNYAVAALTFTNGAGSFNLVSSSASTLTLNGSVTNNSANVQTFNLAVALGGAVTVNAAGNTVVLNGVVSGNNPLTTAGTTVALTGTNTYTGNTSISAGTLAISGAGQLGSGNYAGAITDNGNLAYSSSASNTLSGIISGSGTLTVQGPVYLTLGADNSYTGGTIVNGGILDMGNNHIGALGSGSLTLSNGTVLCYQTTQGGIISNNIVCVPGTTNELTLNVLSGKATWLTGNISGSSGEFDFAGTNTSGGQTSVDLGGDFSANSGVFAAASNLNLRFRSAAAGNTPNVSWNLGNAGTVLDSKVDNTATTYYLGALSGGTNSQLSGHASSTGGAGANITYDIGALGLSTTFAGTISDGNQTGGVNNTSIAKVGSGSLTLSGADTYNGTTTVSNGTLLVNGSLAGTNVVTVTGGTLGGAGTISGATTLNAGTLLAPGTNGIGTLTFSGSLTLNAASTNSFVVNSSGATSNSMVVVGQLSPNGSVIKVHAGAALALGTYPLFTYGSAGTGSFGTPVLDVTPAGAASITMSAGTVNLVIGSSVNPNPTNIVTSVSGNTLTMSWPADHTGWLLQSNSLALSNTNGWFTVPGSSTTNKVIITINPASAPVFYRMKY